MLKGPKDWNTARLAAAKKWVDDNVLLWQWTVEQHERGAEFGSTQCKPNVTNEEMEEKACTLSGATATSGAPTTDPAIRTD